MNQIPNIEETHNTEIEEIECTCGKDDLYGALYYPHAAYCPKSKL